MPSVQAIGVKLCPAPTHFTRVPLAAASFTMPTSSPSLRGFRTEAGAHCWLPAQFDHDVRPFMLTPVNLAVRLTPPRPACLPPGAGGADALGSTHDPALG